MLRTETVSQFKLNWFRNLWVDRLGFHRYIIFVSNLQNWCKWSLACVGYRVKKYLLSIQDGRQKSKMAVTKFSFFYIFASWFLESDKTQKNKTKIQFECSEPVEKKTGHSNNFWLSYGPLKCYCKWSKMSFSWITPKILTFEYYAKNKTYSEVNFICVYQVWSKLIEKCTPKIQDSRHEI